MKMEENYVLTFTLFRLRKFSPINCFRVCNIPYNSISFVFRCLAISPDRMNTLLANGEVPGLFEGDEYTTLMTQCKEGSQREGLMLDSSEELYKW